MDFSYGFRPKRSCHQAVNRLDKVVMTRPVNHVVDVDIEKFFDNVSHYWLLRCLEERINDPNFLLLVRRFLKAGIWEEGKILPSKRRDSARRGHKSGTGEYLSSLRLRPVV